MITKLIKIHCINPYQNSGDKIKLEIIDDHAYLSYAPTYRLFKKDEIHIIGGSIPNYGQGAKLKLHVIHVMPEILIGEKSIRVSHASQGEKTVRFQKDMADYEITYEVS
ncbi:MAG: hypothetical protein DA328_03815 [Nitrososphaeraceae archaeon]|nr:hypothetical protein [Nitrososphaeraceae archaeon]